MTSTLARAAAAAVLRTSAAALPHAAAAATLRTAAGDLLRTAAAALLRIAAAALLRALALVAPFAPAAFADEPVRENVFGDPFVQATSARERCPEPEGPLYTKAEAKSEAHQRSEKGTTCHLWGRCRLPNAYLYDAEIIPRVVRFIRMDPRFRDSSVWLVGQRRWVYLQGCVGSRALARTLAAEVRRIDDVEAVVDQLMVGDKDEPPYPVRVRK